MHILLTLLDHKPVNFNTSRVIALTFKLQKLDSKKKVKNKALQMEKHRPNNGDNQGCCEATAIRLHKDSHGFQAEQQ